MRILGMLFIFEFFTMQLLADDFTLVNGKQYKGVTVENVEPDGITVMTDSGIEKLYFVWLPKDVQQKYHYNAQTAAAYSAQSAQAQHDLYQQAEQDRANAAQATQQAQDAQGQSKATAANAAKAETFPIETDQAIQGGELVETVTMEEWQAGDVSSMASVGGGGGVGGLAEGVTYHPTGKVLFIQGMPVTADGDHYNIKAYRDGLVTHNGDTLEKWVYVSEKALH